MSESTFLMVPFRGSDLTAVEVNGELHVAIRPICEAIGLDWSAQFRRVKRDPILATCVAITAMQVPGEIQKREVMTLPISHLNGFLFGITASRTRPEVMESLIVYQRECYRVLHDYWMKGAAANPRFGSQNTRTPDILRLIDAVKVERHPVALRIKYDLLHEELTARNMAVPALEDFAPTIYDDAEADALLARIDALVAAKPDLDLHRTDTLMAVRLRDLEENGVPVPKSARPALRRHARFAKVGSVNSRGGKNEWCWVFRCAELYGFTPG